MYWGATISGETYGQSTDAPENQSAWDLFERHAGKRVGLLNMGQGWLAFDKASMDATRARGAIPLVTMGLPSGVTLADVVAGKQDSAIRAWAQAAKAWGHPFFFSLWWEMNGNWYAWGRNPDFVAAWRHFHDLAVEEGATNVTWTWTANSIWSDPESDPGPYYPGDSYVDWVGIDSYNWGENPAQPDEWIDPDQTLSPTLSRVKQIAPGKPVAIVEDASSEIGGNKADWIREMLGTYLPHHPEIKAYLWFDWNFPKGGLRADWPIESSVPAQEAFRGAIQSSVFRSASPALPLLSKVPPPPAPGAGETSPLDLGSPAEAAGGPRLAVAPDGTATVVWSARAGNAFTVYERRIAPDGVPAPAVSALSASPQDALSPQLAVAPDGTVTVVWVRFDGSHFQVQARRIAPDGSIDPSTKDMSTGGQDAGEPQVAIASDGTATVVWKRFDGSNFIVQERRIAPDGTREASVHTLSEAHQDAVEPQVAVAPDGTATVVWSRYDGSDSIVQAARVDPAGMTQTIAGELSAAGASAIEPQLAVAPDGAATVVWVRSDGANSIVQARRISATGTVPGAPFDLSAAGQSAAQPRIAVDQAGMATAVWERFDGTGFAVQARRIDPTGAPAGTALSLSASGRDAVEPQLAIRPGGASTVAWSRFDGSDFIVQKRAIAADGALGGGVEGLSAPGHSASHPQLGSGPDGAVTVTWDRFNSGGDVVQAAIPGQPPPPPPTPSPAGPSSVPAPAVQVLGGDVGSFAIGRALLNRDRGSARLPVTVPSAGELRLYGARPVSRVAGGAETVLLSVRAIGAKGRRLWRRGMLRLRLTVTFVPSGGSAERATTTVKLRRSRPRRR